MKLFRLGTVAILVLVTMSFTVATHTGTLSKIASIGKHRVNYTCDGVNDYSAVTDITPSTSVAYDAKAGSGITCSTPPAGDCYQFTTTSASTCDNTTNFVCCFTKLTGPGNTCTANGKNGNKVTIHCNSVKPS